MTKGNKILGIDIGGTKTHLGIVQDGIVVKDCIISTSSNLSMEIILMEISNAADSMMEEGVHGIGVGVPGLVDEEKGIVYSLLNIPSWKEVHLKKHLENFFKLPVSIANDANTFAAGEKIYGRGRSYKNFLGLTLGTGMGTGIVINNQIYAGNYSSAGEFGRIPYLDMTLEDYCSGKFFSHQFGLKGKYLKELAESGDRNALDIFSQFGHHLGNAIKIMLYVLSPEAIFVGGSIAEGFNFFSETLQMSLDDSSLKMVTKKVLIEKSDLKNAAILGAAAIFSMNNCFKRPDPLSST